MQPLKEDIINVAPTIFRELSQRAPMVFSPEYYWFKFPEFGVISGKVNQAESTALLRFLTPESCVYLVGQASDQNSSQPLVVNRDRTSTNRCRWMREV